MFPLLDADEPNPLELFQIWLNLPRADKMVEPALLDAVGRRDPDARREGRGRAHDARHRRRRPLRRDAAAVAAAELVGRATRQRRRDLDAQAGARRAVRRCRARRQGTNRTLYFFRGASCASADARSRRSSACALRADARPCELANGADGVELLLLQGRPIGEPVAQHGPFVMNTRAGDPAGVRRLPAHAVRRLAVGPQRPGARARRGPLRAPPGRKRRKAGVKAQRARQARDRASAKAAIAID